MAYTTKTIDIAGYNNKIENEGATSSGRLSATEFNNIISALIEAQNNIQLLDQGVTLDLGNKQSTLQFDSVPTNGSSNVISSGAIFTALNNIASNDLNLIVESAPSGGTLNAAIGNYYVFTTDVTSLEVTLPAAPSYSKVKGCVFFFKTGTLSEGSGVSFTSTDNQPIVFYDGYSAEDNTVYEINAVWNGWAWILAYGIVTGLPAYPTAEDESESESETE